MNEKNRKSLFNKRYLVAAISFVLLVIVTLVVLSLNQELRPDPSSERIIREAAAGQLGKDPNELTDEDFAKITNFYLQSNEITDLKLLDKFINLRSLSFIDVQFPKEKIPGWMKLLAKCGIINLNKRFLLYLEPVSKLTCIESINIYGTNFKNIQPFSNLHNLRSLVLVDSNISNIKPLSKLIKMEELTISDTRVSDIKPLNNLKNLQVLALARNQISNIESLQGLINLKSLLIWEEHLSDLEPIKSLVNLQKLNLSNCSNITDSQVDELQKALPSCEIIR